MTDRADIGGSWLENGEHAIIVATGEIGLAEHPFVLVTQALGSCIGVTVWDAFTRRGGMAHIMLPSPSDVNVAGLPDRFASIAIPKMVEATVQGRSAHRLVAKIVGGATMFAGNSGSLSIGERNITEAKKQLALLRIPLIAEDVGGHHARTMELRLDTGLVLVKSYRYGIKDL